MKNFWNDLPRPIIALAPMAGITDQPFRLICKQFGTDVVFSEMISSDAIWHQKLKIKNLKLKIAYENLIKTLNLIRFLEAECPYVVQIFGSDPEKLAYTAKYISSGEWAKDYRKLNSKFKFEIFNPPDGEAGQIQNSNELKSLKIKNCPTGVSSSSRDKLKIEAIPAGIDLNFGCPAKDVVKVGAGVALMKNPELALQIIKAVKKSTKLSVSVKTRLGWSDPREILEFSKVIESSGADALAIHGRTYRQGFAGPANWEMIYKVKKQLKIPVILNGGVNSVEDYKRVDLNLVDGVMIGRGALGRPWVFKELKNPNFQFSIFNFQLLKETILEHAELVQKLRGERGIIEMRKHLAWYYKGIPDSKEIREKLVKVSSLEEIKQVVGKIQNSNLSHFTKVSSDK